MCIIVAKNSGIKMPSMNTLRICFENNPDGAGFMLADGKAVYGFKGLMTFDEFKSELKRAEKRFGPLDKLPVVMHFRISTHGSVIGGNTHPFPLKGGYREMRKSEWVADQGFAHNGVIYQTSRDNDIKKHNVSDTMVFAKKFINPIARYASIASDTAIMDMLYNIAESKLCFLTRKKKLATRGNFIERDGVLYSNTSFEESRYSGCGKGYSSSPGYYSYDWSNIRTSGNHDYMPRISDFDMNSYIQEFADELGYYPLPEGSNIIFDDGTELYVDADNDIFFDDAEWLYQFSHESYNFRLFATRDEYTYIIINDEEDEHV